MGNGGNGSGSNLYRYFDGVSTQVSPAPPPPGYGPGGGVYGITATANQIYWLSAYSGPSFAPYVTVECGGSGSATLCQPTVDQPTSMLVDANGTFWVGGSAFSGGGAIETSSGASGQFAGGIVQLVNGPGAAVWGILDSYPSYAIARFAAAGSSISTTAEFPLPSGDAAGSITYGGDGALWFTDQQRNAIGRIDASGNVLEYPVPTANALGQPWYGLWQIATACDGTVWFTEPGAGKIARIDAKGSIVEIPLPTSNAYPDAISAVPMTHCTSPELWVAEQYSNKIASIAF
jgi:virginiamycin B lyase